MADLTPSTIGIIAPCFNESESIGHFLQKLDEVLGSISEQFVVVIVDDCSTDNSLDIIKNYTFRSSNVTLKVLGLLYNSGHQAVIFQGLLYAQAQGFDHIIVMDSDGEDDPEAIPHIVQKKDYDIVEVKRGKRNESLKFRFFYYLYKMLFKLVTNKKMDYGNYSMISKVIVERVANTSFIHFPAYLLKQKAKKTSIVYDRSKRIDGKSKMGLQGLLFHAFRSFIEFAEDLLMIFLKMFVLLSVVILIMFVNVLYQKFVADTAILGWFSTLTISLVILATICLGFFVTGLLLLNLMHQSHNKMKVEIYNIIK